MNEQEATALAEALSESGLLRDDEDTAMLILKVTRDGDDAIRSLSSAQSSAASPRTMQLIHALGYALDQLLERQPTTWPDDLRAPWVRDDTQPKPDAPSIVPEDWQDLGGDTDA